MVSKNNIDIFNKFKNNIIKTKKNLTSKKNLNNLNNITTEIDSILGSFNNILKKNSNNITSLFKKEKLNYSNSKRNDVDNDKDGDDDFKDGDVKDGDDFNKE